MRKLVLTFLLVAMMSTWALSEVVPMDTTSGGNMVLSGDPHPYEEWDD